MHWTFPSSFKPRMEHGGCALSWQGSSVFNRTSLEHGYGGSALSWQGSSLFTIVSLEHGYGAPPLPLPQSNFFHSTLCSVESLSTQQKSKRLPRPRDPASALKLKVEKQPKLLRTWTEGRKVLSRQLGPKVQNPRVEKKKDAEVARDEQVAEESDSIHLDNFYSEEEDNEDAVDDQDATRISSDNEGAVHALPDVAKPADGLCNTDLKCDHFTKCSGCVIETALDQPPILKDAKRFFRCHGIQDLELTTGCVWEWRCKAKLAIQGTSKNPIIGLYLEGTHNATDIPKCRTHHPRINAAVEILRGGIKELGIQPYDEDSRNGELRYVQMLVTTYNTSLPAVEQYANGRVQMVLVWNARSEQSSNGTLLRSLAEFLWLKGGPKSANPILHSIWANFQTSQSNVIFGGKWRHLLGEQQCWERIGGIDVSLAPSSFSQANLQAFKSLLWKVQKFVDPGKAVVELYAGSGIIGLSLAVTRECRVVKCVEVNKESGASFEQTLSRLPNQIKSRVSWHCADVSVSPINWLKGSEIVVVDPPRNGLDASVIDALRTASLKGQGKSKPTSKEKIEKYSP